MAAILKGTITAINRTRRISFRLLYQLLQIACSPLLALYLLYRGLRDRRYFRGLGERLGWLPAFQTSAGSFWFHAVSVGEVLSAVELIRRLREARPGVGIYVSTTTLAGRATAEQRLKGLADGIFFAPLDYVSIVRRVLRRLKPSLLVVLETEIWPNLYHEARKAGAALVVVNGRISDRALPKYRGWSWFFGETLAEPHAIFVQTEEDRRRYLLTGAPEQTVHVGGNLKYDFRPPGPVNAEIARYLDQRRAGAIWVAASTMPAAAAGDPDEDDAVIAAFGELRQLHPALLLILVPRRPERFELAAQKLAAAGLSYVRRSEIAKASGQESVLLLDTIGELAPLFERADVVFMGGTLASRGGHNILEPAYFAKPVITGPHMENFAAIDAEFRAADAVIKIDGAEQLASRVSELLLRPDHCAEIGGRARELAEAKRGAADVLARELLAAAGRWGLPDPRRTLLARLFLTPLSWLWRLGNHRNIASGLARQRRLSTPVISVGGLSMGGVGKSPLVAHLARRLAESGETPAILTRGYRRKSTEPIVIVPKGVGAGTELTGDEAQTFVRLGVAHVGVGGDRYAAGKALEQQLKPSAFLLDDGFQHVRLHRDQDLVLLDALDPLAGGVFPLGRRREPLESLQRATVVIVTRVEPGQDVSGIEALVQHYNPQAAVFRCRMKPVEWVEAARGETRALHEPGPRKVAAFCGLGSPGSFWKTLRELGLEVVYRWEFGDHHRYSPVELTRFARQAREAGAEALVTTEKDAMNLPERWHETVRPLALYWLRIGVEIEDEARLLDLVRSR